MWYNTKMEYQKVKCKLNKREQNVNVSIMKEVIPRSEKLIWSAEKYNEQTPVKTVQAVPLTGSFSKPPEFLPARGTRPNRRKKNSNVFLKKKQIIPKKNVRLQLGLRKSKMWGKP